MKTQIMNSPEKSALLAHQAAIKQTKAAVRRLEKAVSEQEALISETKAQEPDLVQLKLERKDALAAAALGLKTDGLAGLDAAIEAAEALLRTIGPTVKRAQETVEGLERMLKLEQDKLDALNAQSAGLQRCFLLSEAEIQGAQYAALAIELVKRYKVLTSLGELLLDRKYVPAIHPHAQPLHIPCFSLESNRPYADCSMPDAIYSAPRTRADAMGWQRDEVARLRADGIEID